MTTYITADTHFGHDTIRRYCDRPFVTAAEMDEEMVSYIHEVRNLSEQDIAFLMDSDVSLISGWIRRAGMPTRLQVERLAELSAMVERLSWVVDSEYIPVWLHTPVAALDGEKPRAVLARGDHSQLSRLISELESPTFY